MLNLIEQKIKELFGGKGSFCKQQGYKPKDFASKLRTLEKKIEWVKEFIEPINLEVKIVEKDKS